MKDKFLNTLGINNQETPHSLRAGCAITVYNLGSPASEEPLMSHVGWQSQSSAALYTRSTWMDQANRMAKAMVEITSEPQFIEDSMLPPALN